MINPNPRQLSEHTIQHFINERKYVKGMIKELEKIIRELQDVVTRYKIVDTRTQMLAEKQQLLAQWEYILWRINQKTKERVLFT